MKFNKWTLGLAAVGAVSLTSAVTARADGNQWGGSLPGLNINGAISTSITAGISPGGSDFYDAPISGVPLQEDKQDGFNLDVIELNFEKPMGEGDYASGFKVQLIMGPDALYYNMPWNGGGGSGFTIKDAYVALRTPVGNGIDWKIGSFGTILGFETFEAWNNPNYTRSWGWGLEPTQHTGVLGTYRWSDNLSTSAGVANTLSSGINTRDDLYGSDGDHYWNKTWMVLATVTAPDSWGGLSGSTMTAAAVGGANLDSGESDQMNVYAGWVIPNLVKDTSFGAAFDYVAYNNDDEAEVINLGLYVSHQWTEKLSTHFRGEYGWYCDDFNNEGCWYGTTATIEYALWANVISRLEFRNEIANDGFNPGNANSSSYDSKCGQAVYLNFIYKFL